MAGFKREPTVTHFSNPDIKTTVSWSIYVLPNEIWESDVLGKVPEDAVVVYFNVLSRHVSGGGGMETTEHPNRIADPAQDSRTRNTRIRLHWTRKPVTTAGRDIYFTLWGQIKCIRHRIHSGGARNLAMKMSVQNSEGGRGAQQRW
jgi:hypothetical protein